MDGEVLLKKIYKIQDDTEHKIKSFQKQYENLVAKQNDSGMEFDYRAHRNTSNTAVGTSLRAIDRVRSLDTEVADFTKTLQKNLPEVLPDSPVKLRRLLEKDVKCDPVIPEGDYGLPQSFYSAARRINKLNSVLAQINLIAKEIENVLDKKAIKLKYISAVSYDRAKNILTINSKKMIIGDRGGRISALLFALFGDGRHNLVSHDVDDARVFEIIEEADPEKYGDKASQRKCALDVYRIINDKVRKNIPNGEDLIVRIENGFAINPKLIK